MVTPCACLCLQPIGYEGFQQFMEYYLDAVLPDDLAQHLFLSFMRRPMAPASSRSHLTGKDCHVKDIAMAASQTLCAPVMHQSTDNIEPLATPTLTLTATSKDKHSTIAEKLHGLSEKIQALGHVRHDSSGGESGRSRSRAGQHARTPRSCCTHALGDLKDSFCFSWIAYVAICLSLTSCLPVATDLLHKSLVACLLPPICYISH